MLLTKCLSLISDTQDVCKVLRRQQVNQGPLIFMQVEHILLHYLLLTGNA
jgi:hypothetical protein